MSVKILRLDSVKMALATVKPPEMKQIFTIDLSLDEPYFIVAGDGIFVLSTHHQ